MSVESAKKFIEQLKSDEELRAKFAATETLEAKSDLIKGAGCSFTGEDYKKAVEEVGEPVSDEDLDGAAGGCSFHISVCETHLF